MASSLEQNTIIGTGSHPEASATERLMEVDDVVDSVHIDAESILREVEERQNKGRDARVIFFRAFLRTEVKDYAELCANIARQMSQELKYIRPDILNEEQFVAFLSLLLNSFDPTQTSLGAFLVLNIKAFAEERAKPRQTEGNTSALTQEWLAAGTVTEGEENLEIASTLQRAFNVYQGRGFARPPNDQIALTAWLGEEKQISIQTYGDGVWILAQEFLHQTIQNINDYCCAYPEINSSEFLYRGLYAIFRSIDLYIPNEMKTMGDFVESSVCFALDKTAGD
jgi:hypothetical protein